MDRQQILDYVRNHILATNTGLYPDDVTEFASLTYDLGMDSLHLESLISGLKENVAEMEFTPWYIKASRRGYDTVGSLVDYIEERVVELQATRAPEAAAPAEAPQAAWEEAA
jgi:acyl carrier protein